MPCNQLKLSGLIVKHYPIRQSPSGVKIAQFVLEHLSTQLEAQIKCVVKCKMFCVWVSPDLQMLQNCTNVEVSGFISQNAKLQLVLHITECLDKGN